MGNKGRMALEAQGLRGLGSVHWNLSTAELYEHVLRRSEGRLSRQGALVVLTGQHTGRSANDKFIVCDDSTRDTVWWGKVNAPYESNRFEALFERMTAY